MSESLCNARGLCKWYWSPCAFGVGRFFVGGWDFGWAWCFDKYRASSLRSEVRATTATADYGNGIVGDNEVAADAVFLEYGRRLNRATQHFEVKPVVASQRELKESSVFSMRHRCCSQEMVALVPCSKFAVFL